MPVNLDRNYVKQKQRGIYIYIWYAKILNTCQQFNFFTLSKSEALALARTSFRVSFIAHQLR